MKLKLPAAVIVLLIALMLQFWLASAGIFIDLSFASLIAFAFTFGFLELLVLILAAVFVINWQPAVSPEILVFALFPALAGLFHNFLRWQTWFFAVIGIALGTLVMYFVALPGGIFMNFGQFGIDLLGSLAWGACIVAVFVRWGR